MFKKILIGIVSLTTLVYSETVKDDVSSVLPSDNDTVRCYYDSVAVKLKARIKVEDLKSYKINVFDEKSFEPYQGTITYTPDKLLLFTPNDPFKCGKKLIAIVNKGEDITKTNYIEYFNWSFSTKDKVDSDYIQYKKNVIETTSLNLSSTILNTYNIELKEFGRDKTNPDEISSEGSVDEAQLKILSNLVKQGKWQDAETLALELFENAPSSPRVNFYLGMAYFNQKKFDDAVGAYERVIIVRPKHVLARLELAKTLFMVEQYDESESEFEKVLEDEKLPAAVEKNVQYFLDAIEQTRKRHTLVLIAMGELKQEMKEDKKNSGTEKFDDSLHQELLITSYSYDYGKVGGWKSNNNLIFINNNKFNCSGDTGANNDAHCRSGVQGFILAAGIDGPTDYGKMGISLTKPFLTAFTNAAGATKEVGVDGLDIKFIYSHKITKDIDFAFDYTLKDGTTVMDDLNLADKLAKGYIYNVTLSKLLQEPNKLDFKYTYQDIREETDGASTDFDDKITKKYNLAYLYNFDKKLSLTSSYEIVVEDDDNNLNVNNDYEKDTTNINLKLSYKYEPTLVLSGGITNEDTTKKFINSGGSKFDETTKGNTLNFGVMYIFTPINF